MSQCLSSGNSQRIFQKTIEEFDCKSMAELRALEAELRRAWAGQEDNLDKHKHKVFPSLQQLLLATTGLLEEKVLPLLTQF